MEYGSSVQELLNTKYMKNITRVLAGKEGLDKIVRWVHVLEIRDVVEQCVNGKEMVLTTGIGFTTKEVAIKFLQELIDQNVSALCIETALYYHKVDQELIDLANLNDFPLIEIPEISRFLDISKGLNTLLINNESRLYNDADQYDQKFNDVNSKGTIEDGIRYTADYLDIEVAFLPDKGNQYGATLELKKLIASKLETLESTLQDNEIYVRGHFAIKRINFLGKTWGHLVFNSKKKDLSEYETLILSRLSIKIKEDIFSKLVASEEKNHMSKDWIKKWLEGLISESDVRKKIRELGFNDNFSEFIVCCSNLGQTKFEQQNASYYDADAGINTWDCFENLLSRATIVLRNIFEKMGFSVLGYLENDIIYFIIMNPHNLDDTCEKVEQGFLQLKQYKSIYMDHSHSIFSIGKKVTQYKQLKKSCDTALKLFNNVDRLDGDILIYDKLYIKRIMLELDEKFVLDEFILDNLGDLLKSNNFELLQTLKVYFDCNCSKQKTAEILFIVRQTLYFRLQKIEDILGKDYHIGERRFALEFAIHAYLYLENLKVK